MKRRAIALAFCTPLLLMAPLAAAAAAEAAQSDQDKLNQFDGVWEGPDSLFYNLAPPVKMEDPQEPTPPLKGEYMKKFEAVVADLLAKKAGGAGGPPPPPTPGKPLPQRMNPCGPDIPRPPRMGMGMPAVMTGGMGAPFEFVAAKGRLYFINVATKGFRRIYVDGQPHSSADDLIPNRNGESVGHWEGNTLVVDTIGIVAGPIDPQTCHSGELRIIERFTFLDPDTLQDEMTLEDPQALAKPWVSTRIYRRTKDTRVIEIEPDDDIGAAPVATREL